MLRHTRGNGKGSKQRVFVVHGAIFKGAACCKGEDDVNPATEDAKVECVVAAKSDEPMLWQNCCVKEMKKPVLGRLDCGDVAGQPARHVSKLIPPTAEEPPLLTELLIPVYITLRFHAVEHELE